MYKRTVRAAASSFVLALCCLFCGAQTVSNPILPNADPFITLHRVNGKYLLLATTGRNITIWSGPTVPPAASESKVVFTPQDGLTELWSPTIWWMSGRWWIYFTARAPGGEHAIYALESDTEDSLGSYTFRGPLALGGAAIDPSVLTIGGENYLMYVSLGGGENAIELVRLAGPTQTVGRRALIAEPEYPWEKGAGTTKTYPVNEGPTALYHAGKTFIVYSASDTASPSYCLGLLTFAGGDPLDRKNWSKSAEPVFAAAPANGIYGPGRGTFAEAEGGSYWMLYAAKSTDEPTAANRAVRAQRFGWKAGGSPDFGVPEKDGPVSGDRAPSIQGARADGPVLSGVEILTDTQGVDFGPYMRRVMHTVYESWVKLIPKEAQPPTHLEGSTVLRFTIAPDGCLGSMHLDASTHEVVLDRAAWGAITSIRFPELPKAFSGPNLTLRIRFVVGKDGAAKSP
jgi:GH43 family beta-xylosidase